MVPFIEGEYDFEMLETKKINGYYHGIYLDQKAETYVMLTNRTTPTPFGNCETGVAVILNDGNMENEEIESLFLYMQIYIKGRWS